MALRTILVSLVLHAGVAASVVAGGSGHAVGRAASPQPLDVVEVETVAESVDVTPSPSPVERTEDVAKNPVAAPPPAHTHPYAVPADHDARPHDPALPHDHPGAGEHPHAAGEAPPALTSVVPARPVFAMSSGNGSIAAGSTRVAADARGGGDGIAREEREEAGAAAATYAASAVTVPAKLVAAARAAYPPDARADDVEGDVALEIVVDADGKVVDARVARPAGHGFDESALAAIRAYRFSPAEREGRRVRVRMPWTVQFRLR